MDIRRNTKIYLIRFMVLFVTKFPIQGTSTDDFQDPPYFEHAMRSRFFVDKTSLLKEFTANSFEVITCPKNFGKTTNLDMIRRFFQIPYDEKTRQLIDRKTSHYYKLFTNHTYKLEISTDQEFLETYFGKYSVLYLSFGTVSGSSPEQIMNSILETMKRVFVSYQWLYEEIKDGIQTGKYPPYMQRLHEWETVSSGTTHPNQFIWGIRALGKFLQLYFGRAGLIVLIDDYDVPIKCAILAGVDGRKIQDFMQWLMEIHLQEDGRANRMMITGVSRLFKDNMNSDRIDMINYHYFLEDDGTIGQYFGLNFDDVQILLTIKRNDRDKDKIKNFFNGYRAKRKKTQYEDEPKPLIYHLKGVLRYLESNTLESEDYNSEITPQIMKCLRHQQFFQMIRQLLMKNVLVTPFVKFHLSMKDFDTVTQLVKNNCPHLVDRTPYMVFFIDNGYLTWSQDSDSLEIPNVIMKNRLQREFEQFYLQTYKISITNSFLAASIKSIFNSKETTNAALTKLTNSLQQVLHSELGHWDEFQFHSIIFGLLYRNLNFYQDLIKVTDIEGKTGESDFNGIDKLKILNHVKKILLIIKITYKGKSEDAVQEALKYVPLEPRNTSAIEVVKYLGINVNEHNQIQVAKGKSRKVW